MSDTEHKPYCAIYGLQLNDCSCKQSNNWKKELKEQGFIVMLPAGRHASNAELELQYFISTKIIKKLIEEIDSEDLPFLRKKLTEKWL